MHNITGRVNSIQSLGTLDGPGIRFVIFMQGCNLRCGCCHNPDTWNPDSGTLYTAEELVNKAAQYKEYFGKEGGITTSGGEPLLQAEFLTELFSKCHERGINTCLDTSGSILNEKVKKLLEVTDRVLLDIKYTNDTDYRKYVGCGIGTPLKFLEYLNEQSIPTTLRQVIIPELNGTAENISVLSDLQSRHHCIDKTELLPFKKICKVKYDNLDLDFEFEKYTAPTAEYMEKLNQSLVGH